MSNRVGARDRPLSSWIFDLGAEVYSWFTAQRTWRASCARLAERLPDRPGLRALDLGCGPGVSTIEIARRRPAAFVVGLDIAPRMLAEARRWLRRARRAGGPAGTIRWVIADVAQLPFPAHTFDAATGHSFLYLLPDRPAALGEVRRALRPGGQLVLMEPNAQPATPRQVLGVGRGLRHIVSVALWRLFSRAHGRYTPESLRATLRQAGFADAAAESTLDGLGVLATASREHGARP